MAKELFSKHDPFVASSFVTEQEGLKLNAYKCTAGVWTIGVGHTGGVKPGDKISYERAMELLRQDLSQMHNEMKPSLKNAVLTRNQFVALMSLVFNMGSSKISASTLVKLLNQGNYEAAAAQFLRWKYVNGQPDERILKRREREKKLFETEDLIE